MSPELTLKPLLGKTLTSVEGAVVGQDEIIFDTEAQRFRMYHSQDCCECVRIYSVEGDLQNLIGAPIESALESCSNDDPPECPDSWTWTLFTITTAKGTVRIKWLGESNGYYGEGVDFCEITQKSTS
jgi:hypothetical protein